MGSRLSCYPARTPPSYRPAHLAHRRWSRGYFVLVEGIYRARVSEARSGEPDRERGGGIGQAQLSKPQSTRSRSAQTHAGEGGAPGPRGAAEAAADRVSSRSLKTRLRAGRARATVRRAARRTAAARFSGRRGLGTPENQGGRTLRCPRVMASLPGTPTPRVFSLAVFVPPALFSSSDFRLSAEYARATTFLSSDAAR